MSIWKTLKEEKPNSKIDRILILSIFYMYFNNKYHIEFVFLRKYPYFCRKIDIYC